MGRLLIVVGVALVGVASLMVAALIDSDKAETRVQLGNGPKPMLFVTRECGSQCKQLRNSLSKRLDFDEYDAFDGGAGAELYAQSGGDGELPYVVIGEQRIAGNYPGELISAIAIEYGDGQLGADERDALSRNFDRDGNPRVVMYANSWCGYCDQARDYFKDRDIELVEFDIELDTKARRDFDILRGRGTPLLYHGFRRVDGFNVPKIEREFNFDAK